MPKELHLHQPQSSFYSVDLRNQSECEKNMGQKNFGYGHFLNSDEIMPFNEMFKNLGITVNFAFNVK